MLVRNGNFEENYHSCHDFLTCLCRLKGGILFLEHEVVLGEEKNDI